MLSGRRPVAGARYFPRAGGQTFNSGVTDLNLLCAVFLEKSGNNPEAMKSFDRSECPCPRMADFCDPRRS